MSLPATHHRLGEWMLAKGLISEDQLEVALIEQRKHGLPLGQQLVRLSFVTDALVRDALAQQHARDSIDLTHVIPDAALLAKIPEAFARQYKVVPVDEDADGAVSRVAMADVFDVVVLDRLQRLLGHHVRLVPMLATQVQIEQALDRCYGYALSLDDILHEIEHGQLSRMPEAGEVREYHHPVVRLVNAILLDAVKQAASDIHFEPEQAFVRIRYRLDGVLSQVRSLHQRYWPALCVRLKLLAGMNIAEQRSPQDGRVSLFLCGRDIDFRVSILPTLFGENVVLRVLDRQQAHVTFSDLGLRAQQQAQLLQLLTRPEGMLIVTGPTGSGKTTTLYALLSQLNNIQVNIMTLEDPVEYPMPLMRQTSVNAANKVDFANGIRAMMRQDPDIILVGEIRDEATASMALRAAMTGHLVMTTLHSNSAPAAIARLQDLGITPHLMAGNLVGVLGQRLLRRLCPHCKQPLTTTHPLGGLVQACTEAQPTLLEGPCQLYQPLGCARCRMTGYRGRILIMEIMPMLPAMDALLDRQARLSEWRQQAAASGYTTLAEEGLRHVLQGDTSLDELQRVVDVHTLFTHPASFAKDA